MLPRQPNGFTLIEMLIAITLLGVMVTLLFGSLRIAAQSWHSGETKIDQVNRKAVVYQFFKHHLSAARPLPEFAATDHDALQTNTEQEPLKLSFQGLPQSLRFVAALPAASTRKGLQVFAIEPARDRPSTLTVTLTPYRQQVDAEPEPVVLLDEVRSFRISYFGAKNPNAGDPAGWQDDWLDAERLPNLVKIHIALNDGSFWPDMIFPLRIDSTPLIGDIVGQQIPPNEDAN
ncbi:prepilin-type N-terminal cleavage/methylation domain-containing protein [Methylomonas sp. SURF-1]|uniref:Prepilin-type N-terminal cleavage/methylation domain-containing protein n=1 Tax=Methylomonas aurea TaxID=2952224 RepID=A0ABT1UCQ6_9GAMM|nr:prepilin-type N-terminal cleavage/methylation domain-containing protein [Methylomonas sp. SURF-1]